MYLPLMKLIKDGEIGETMKSRGGVRHRYQYLVFAKIKKNTVWCMNAYTWKSIAGQNYLYDGETDRKHHEEGYIIAVCTPECIEMRLESTQTNKTGLYNDYVTYRFASFASLNILHDVYERYSKGISFIHTKDEEFLPMKKMKFSWEGSLISKIPKKTAKRWVNIKNEWRLERNAQSRARYAQTKAERVFKQYRDKNILEDYPVEQVFHLQNAQLRADAIREIGLDKILDPYPTVVVDKDTVDGRLYELVRITLPNFRTKRQGNWSDTTVSRPALYLKMTNPSTGEFHLEGVPTKDDNSWDHIPNETVLGALSWRDGETVDLSVKDGEEASTWEYVRPTTIT